MAVDAETLHELIEDGPYLDMRQATAVPVQRDIGNKMVQGRVVSKTVGLPLFCLNSLATVRGSSLLKEMSYPLLSGTLKVNRKVFRVQIGDVIKFSYSKYGLSNIVFRVKNIVEEDLHSEFITLQVVEDIYSIGTVEVEQLSFHDRTIRSVDDTPDSFEHQYVWEYPYYADTDKIYLIPVAERNYPTVSSFYFYISADGGSSYARGDTLSNFTFHGTLDQEYGLTNTIDTDGCVVTFTTTPTISSTTFQMTLPGQKWVALIGNEVVYFRDITPIGDNKFRLSNVIRGRLDTEKQTHLSGETVWILDASMEPAVSSFFNRGSSLNFKLVPRTSLGAADISQCTAIPKQLSFRARFPLKPVNFFANGSSGFGRYETDIELTWSARNRKNGAGYGAPGGYAPTNDIEGYFKIEVYVGGVLVRTVDDLTDTSWTYTEAMNLSDNGSLADVVEFKLYNWRSEDGVIYTSDVVSVLCKKGDKIEEA